MTRAGNTDKFGFCVRCRVLWQWYGTLAQKDALCPNVLDGVVCRLPLSKKPHPSTIGQHRIETRVPLIREGLEQKAKAS